MRTPTPSDPESRTIELDGQQFCYTDEGEGPVVLALHGLPGSVRDFRWLGAAVEPRVRMIRLDLPGFGATRLSAFPAARFPPRAHLVLRLMSALGVDRFAVVAHSAGGPLALEVAVQAPHRVFAVGQIATPGLRPHRAFRDNGWSRTVGICLDFAPVRMALLPMVRTGFERAGFPKNLSDDSLWQTMRILRHFDFDAQAQNLRRITAPMMVAWADDDQFVEPKICAEFAEAAPDGPRLRFESGGHYIQKTQSVEIGDALVSWIRDLE